MTPQNESPRGRILLAEDEDLLRWSIERCLAGRGFSVTTAADGAQAAALLSGAAFDVVVTDLALGGVDGLALAAEARRIRPETQVVVITGQGSKEAVLSALRHGVADFIEKPFDLDQLLLTVERTIEKARLHRELVQLSRTDGLTGLYNQRHFQAVLEAEVNRARRQARPLALLLIDVDDFKGYNDRYGHLAGDAALARVAACLRQACRRDIDSAFRIGGDEFVLLLPEADAAAAAGILARARALLAEEGLALTVSAGVAALRDGLDSRGLVREADQEMYRAKRADAGHGAVPHAVPHAG